MRDTYTYTTGRKHDDRGYSASVAAEQRQR